VPGRQQREQLGRRVSQVHLRVVDCESETVLELPAYRSGLLLLTLEIGITGNGIVRQLPHINHVIAQVWHRQGDPEPSIPEKRISILHT